MFNFFLFFVQGKETILTQDEIGDINLYNGDKFGLNNFKQLTSFIHVSKGYMHGKLTLTFQNETGIYNRSCKCNENIYLNNSSFTFSYTSSPYPIKLVYYILPFDGKNPNLFCGENSIYIPEHSTSTIKLKKCFY